MIIIHRIDRNNVGDFVSDPSLYFNFGELTRFDIHSVNKINDRNDDHCIFGGGGLLSPWFYKDIDILYGKKFRSLVSWGVGFNLLDVKNKILVNAPDFQLPILLKNFLGNFDEISLRDFNLNLNYTWVPCASCMSPLFDHYRKIKPNKKLGIFSHKAVPTSMLNIIDQINNSGNDFESKLSYLSQFEFIVTNSYHGLYWATLLNKKCLCVPNKSALFNFKYQPVYIHSKIGDEQLERCVRYENALNECRNANTKFYWYLKSKL